jgi:hypothetical protein
MIPESVMPAPGYCKVFSAEVLDTDVPMDRENQPRFYEPLFFFPSARTAATPSLTASDIVSCFPCPTLVSLFNSLFILSWGYWPRPSVSLRYYLYPVDNCWSGPIGYGLQYLFNKKFSPHQVFLVGPACQIIIVCGRNVVR